jgi:hypothetical protein
MKISILVVNSPCAVRGESLSAMAAGMIRPARTKQGSGLVLVDSITKEDSKMIRPERDPSDYKAVVDKLFLYGMGD